MKDTAKRIRAYKAALPGLKERLAAVALLLVVSTVMMISATFAWITLSRAPEVTGINTTISGNGNLEIALSDKDGLAPDEFDVDESLTKGVNVTLSNLEWGNLINLSDPSYGIDNLALRPAQLNTANLLGSPLWGAVYAEDGRITALDSNYAYAMFNGTEFKTSNEYGVRAIASYTATISDSTQAKYKEMRDAVQTASNAVDQKYAEMIPKFKALGTMMSKYTQDKVDGSNPGTDLSPWLSDVLTVYNALHDAMVMQKQAYTALANFQAYTYAYNTGMQYAALTWEDIETNAASYNTTSVDVASKNGVVSLVDLNQFRTDLKTLEVDISYLEQYINEYKTDGTAHYWGSGGVSGYYINQMISRLIAYSQMTFDLKNDGVEVPFSELTSHLSDAITAGMDHKPRKAFVTNGILKRWEQTAISESYRLNGHAECTISFIAKVMPLEIHGVAYTKASGTSTFAQAFSNAQSMNLTPADQVAEDTYGMAVDLWVRTNAESTCLTLEGATATDENGNIIRYDGANRIWGRVPSTDTIYITESTSQGGGSCYIYYADTPEDMARSLDLLDSMKVAFVSQGGTLLATAEMDTVNYCAVNGRITVPLVLDTNTKTTYTYKDSMNQEVVGKAITTLTYDAAERITAIIYLDGTRLTNDNVLAASEIQGQLNIQFGSSQNLQTIGSNDLIDDVRTVTAAVNKTNIDFDTATSTDDKTVAVTVEINGTTATEVQAFFVRAINSTQGTREKEMKFTEQADHTWTTNYTFTAPGEYYLRHVRLNGVDYALENPLHVTVSGFALKSVDWDQTGNEVVVRTSDGTFSTKVTVEFASNDANKLPNTVQARFVRTDGNTVNVPLSRGTDGKWTGTGNFTTSGVYTLEYLVYTTSGSTGGIYKDLGDMKKTLDLALGMYVEVKDMTGKLVEDYKSDGVYDKKVEVRIYDNAGNAIEELEGAWLYYSNNGSASNTIHSKLTWNAGKYDAILPIKTAGRWMFGYVALKGGQVLTKASGSPTYTIISPDPVAYDDSSKTTYNTPNDSNIQFVPLTNDATINGIKLLHADTATVQVVVYNTVTKSYYTRDLNTVTRTLSLPTYTTGVDADNNPDQSTATQDGTWYVAAIIVSECYDENQTYHGSENPIIWAGSDEISKAYADEFLMNGDVSTVTAYKNFSKLTTTVSGSLNVAFTAGTVNLGADSGYEFMHQFLVQETNMGVKLTDNGNNVIPEKKVSSIKLSVSYTAPKDGVYSYNVESGFGKNYDITFDRTGENENYTVSSNTIWQYVGEYRVNSLEVVIGGVTKTYYPGEIGLPEEYTVRTASYTEKNISVENLVQSTKVFGKNANGLVTGTFLESYDLKGTNVRVTLTPKDVDGNQYVKLDSVEAKLLLTHTGDSQNNGGYTFTNSSLANLEVPMTSQAGNDVYNAGSANLLAGTYSAKVRVKVGSVTETKDLEDISVYSVKPDVTMALSSDTPTTVTVNADGGTAVSTNTFTANNNVVNGGHSAVLFASYRPFTASENPGTYQDYNQEGIYAEYYAHYELPKLTFTLANAGSLCKSFTLHIDGLSKNVVFTGNGTTNAVSIGSVTSGTDERDGVYYTTVLGKPFANSCKYTYKTEKVNALGAKQILGITAEVNGDFYSLTLQQGLSIVQENKAVPSIVFQVDDSDFVTPAGQTSQDGLKFNYTLPMSLTATDGKIYTLKRIEKDPEEQTTTTGDNPDDKIKTVAINDNLNWKDQKQIANDEKVFTMSVTTGSGTHKRLGFTGTYYYKIIESELFTISHWSQYAENSVPVTGNTTEIKTTETVDERKELDYWLVDGQRKNPGETVEVTGNSIVIPHYKVTEELVQREVVTTIVNGTMIYTYRTAANATVTTSNGAGAKRVGKNYYCTHVTCSYNNGTKDDALNDTLEEPKNTGYTKVSSAQAGTVRDTSNSTWERYGDAVNAGGSSTIHTVCYGPDGTTILWEKYTDGDGNTIPQP